jgi:hypothetical protein
MVYRKIPTYAVLTNLYDVIREVVKTDEAFYSDLEVEELKEDENNNFIERGNNGIKRQIINYSE